MTTPIDDVRIEMARDAARDLRDHADKIRDEALAAGNTQAAEWALMMQRAGLPSSAASANTAIHAICGHKHVGYKSHGHDD